MRLDYEEEDGEEALVDGDVVDVEVEVEDVDLDLDDDLRARTVSGPALTINGVCNNSFKDGRSAGFFFKHIFTNSVNS